MTAYSPEGVCPLRRPAGDNQPLSTGILPKTAQTLAGRIVTTGLKEWDRAGAIIQ
jgi:hypothetical protein